MGLLRFADLVGTQTLYTFSLSGNEDPVGAGLTGMLLLVAISGTWAIIDGWRRPLRTDVVGWLLAAALVVLLGSLPDTLSAPAAEGGWTGLSDYLATVAEGAGFMFGLVAVPAAAGLGLGHLIRVSLRRPRPDLVRRRRPWSTHGHRPAFPPWWASRPLACAPVNAFSPRPAGRARRRRR